MKPNKKKKQDEKNGEKRREWISIDVLDFFFSFLHENKERYK